MYLNEMGLKKTIQNSQEVLDIAKYLYYRGEIFLELNKKEEAFLSFTKVLSLPYSCGSDDKPHWAVVTSTYKAMILNNILNSNNNERNLLSYRYIANNFDGHLTATRLKSIHEPLYVLCQSLKSNTQDEVSMQQVLTD